MIKKVFNVGIAILAVVLFTAAMTSVSAAESSLAQRIRSSILDEDNSDYRVADLVRVETAIGKSFEAYDLLKMEPSIDHNDDLCESIENFGNPEMIFNAEEVILKYESDNSELDIKCILQQAGEEGDEEVISMWTYKGVTYQLVAGFSYYVRETGIIGKPIVNETFVNATDEKNILLTEYLSKAELTSVETDGNIISFYLETDDEEFIITIESDTNNTKDIDPIASICHKETEAVWTILSDGTSYFVRGIC